MEIDKIQKQLIKHLSSLDEKEKILFFIKTAHKTNRKCQQIDNLLPNCQHVIWICGHKKNGKMLFEVDSDNEITKGLLQTMCNIFSNHTPKEILAAKIDKKTLKTIAFDKRSPIFPIGSLVRLINKIRFITIQNS